MSGREILDKIKKSIETTDANAIVSESKENLIFIDTGWLNLDVFLKVLEKEFND